MIRVVKWALFGAGLALLVAGARLRRTDLAGAGWAVMGLGQLAGTLAALRRGVIEAKPGPIDRVVNPRGFRDAAALLLLLSAAWIVSGVLIALGLLSF